MAVSFPVDIASSKLSQACSICLAFPRVVLHIDAVPTGGRNDIRGGGRWAVWPEYDRVSSIFSAERFYLSLVCHSSVEP